jgi:Fe-S-cluster containining protein
MRGHQVQLICEASPWSADPGDANVAAAHFKRRSFAATSGSVPIRVAVMLAATAIGACPNLREDMRCGIYEERPLVCRIYPAEVNPAMPIDPRSKRCPPEAWSAPMPPQERTGLVNGELLGCVETSRQLGAEEVGVKARLCAVLGVFDGGLDHETALVYSPTAAVLLAALESALGANVGGEAAPEWGFVSDQSRTIEDLGALGATVRHACDVVDAPYRYFCFRRETLFRAYRATEAAPDAGAKAG